MSWRASAPCRVDLAGGTLDIWPLGLFCAGARTVNVAIDVMVEVDARPAAGRFSVSQDGAQTSSPGLAGLRGESGTALIAEVCDFLGVPGVELAVRSQSPRGGGLGGSSALTVALLAALGEVVGRRLPAAHQLAAEARDLEARLMRLPTGIQDHAPALRGGVVVVEHRIGGSVSRPLECDLEALSAALIVVFTGQSHFSAGNNWAIIRRVLDGDVATGALLTAIADAAALAEESLARADLAELGRAVALDWHHRRQLADEISTPQIERLLAGAVAAGAWGGKACGAGGGGCVVVVAPPERRFEVERRLREIGGEILPARATSQGLQLSHTGLA